MSAKDVIKSIFDYIKENCNIEMRLVIPEKNPGNSGRIDLGRNYTLIYYKEEERKIVLSNLDSGVQLFWELEDPKLLDELLVEVQKCAGQKHQCSPSCICKNF